MLKERITYILIFGMILCVATAYYCKPSPEDVVRLRSEHFWHYKIFGEHKSDIIVVGDSRVQRGVASKRISEILGGQKVFNMGFGSGIIEPEIFNVSRQHLDPNGKKWLILGLSSFSLLNKKNFDFLKYSSADRFDWFALNHLQDVYLRFARLINAADTRECFCIPGAQKTFRSSEDFRIEEGWSPKRRKVTVESVTKTLKRYQLHFEGKPGSSADLQRLKNLLLNALNEDPKLKILIFRFPVAPELQKIEDAESGIDFVKVRDLVHDLKKVHWLEVPLGDYTFYDASHMDEESALRFSNWLGTRLSCIQNLTPQDFSVSDIALQCQ